MTLYRAFPFDPAAAAGLPFAADHVPRSQGSGRFDRPDGAVWYLAESVEHAVAELLQGFRGRPFHASMLRRSGHPLALCAVDLPVGTAAHIVNLDDPAELLRLDIAPSTLASDDRVRTQDVASRVHADGATGLRWWSRLSGDWHTVVVFLDRLAPGAMRIGEPRVLLPEHPAVHSACRTLGISTMR